jgi:hypothetical protein
MAAYLGYNDGLLLHIQNKKKAGVRLMPYMSLERAPCRRMSVMVPPSTSVAQIATTRDYIPMRMVQRPPALPPVYDRQKEGRRWRNKVLSGTAYIILGLTWSKERPRTTHDTQRRTRDGTARASGAWVRCGAWSVGVVSGLGARVRSREPRVDRG